MFRLFLASVCCSWVICISFAAQPANAQGKIWRKHDLQSIDIPPPNVVSNTANVSNLSVETFHNYSLARLAQNGIKAPGITVTTQKSLSVHGTPDIHQRISENIAHLKRPETKNVQFVMEINYLTLKDTHEYNQEYKADNLGKILWKENQYGLLKIGTGTRNVLAEKLEIGVGSHKHPYLPYLRPIPDRKDKKTYSGVNLYWVAKEDMPKMQEAWRNQVHQLKGDKRFRHEFRSQPVITSNGQLGVNMEDASFPFTLSEKKWYKSSPTYENIFANKMFTSVSVISVDGRTVSSDVDIIFPQLPKLPSPKTPLVSIPFSSKNTQGIYDSKMDHLTISEENLIWSADGMLVVFLNGIPLIAEGKIETKKTGVPFLAAKRVYTLAEHEAQVLTGILTIRMVSPNDISPTGTSSFFL